MESIAKKFHINEATDVVRKISWTSVTNEFRTYVSTAEAMLAELKKNDPEGYRKREQDAKASAAREQNAPQVGKPLFSPLYEQQKRSEKLASPEVRATEPAPATKSKPTGK